MMFARARSVCAVTAAGVGMATSAAFFGSRGDDAFRVLHTQSESDKIPPYDPARNGHKLKLPEASFSVGELVHSPAVVSAYNALARHNPAMKTLDEALRPAKMGAAAASLNQESFKQSLPVLQQGKSDVHSMSRLQLYDLLAAMLFGFVEVPTTDRHKFRKMTGMNYPTFSHLLDDTKACNTEKLACFLHYFERIYESPNPPGSVVFRRVAMRPKKADFWASRTHTRLCDVEFVTKGGIEDMHDAIMVDFANKFLGGGLLSNGCVQEEILMALHPETAVGLLLFPVMADNEAILISGAERFSKYKGYASGFRYNGDYEDPAGRVPPSEATPELTAGSIKRRMLAIDATPYSDKPGKPAFIQQLEMDSLLRELNKAFIGFSVDVPECPKADVNWVATGNWGCGVFGGNLAIKAVLQWLAVSEGGRRMRYLPFGSKVIEQDFARFVSDCRKKHITVASLWLAMESLSANSSKVKPEKVFEFLRTELDLPA